MERKSITFVLICMVITVHYIVALDLVSQNVNATDWTNHSVDQTNDQGGYTSIETDSNGFPHISYYDGNNSDLKYATSDGTDWIVKTVDSDGSVGKWSSLALDDNENPHISYFDDSKNIIKYARWSQDNWEIEKIDDCGENGGYTSIDLDNNYHPFISYYDNSNRVIKYAKWTGSNWNITVVASAGYEEGFTSLALDSNYYPHIAYFDKTEEDLMYARWDGNAWIIETIDDYKQTGTYPALALDSEDKPHVSYYSSSANSLYYSYKARKSWNLETLDYTGEGGTYTSIAINEHDHIHISYNLGGSVRFARRYGGIWDIEWIPFTEGTHTSITADTQYVHISYFDSQSNEIKYVKGLMDIIDSVPPGKPETPRGPTVVEKGRGYRYSTFAEDPDNHSRKYRFDWGDGEVIDSGYFSSVGGIYGNGSMSHTWNSVGTYQVKVKAIDICSNASEWSSYLKVNVIDSDPYSTYFIMYDTYGMMNYANVTTTLDNLNLTVNQTVNCTVNVKFESYGWGLMYLDDLVVTRVYIVMFTDHNPDIYDYENRKEIYSTNVYNKLENISDEITYELSFIIEEPGEKIGILGVIECFGVDYGGNKEHPFIGPSDLHGHPPTIDINVKPQEESSSIGSTDPDVNYWLLIILIILVLGFSITSIYLLKKRRNK